MNVKAAQENIDLLSVNAPQGRKDRAWAEISLKNLAHNAHTLKRALPLGCDIMAVVKANAYGHGDTAVAKALFCEGVRAFAVATIDEGVNLRHNGIKGEILILGHTDPRRSAELTRYDLTQTITDEQYAKELNGFCSPVHAHIKIDTGMHRLGESYKNEMKVARIFSYPYLIISGIYTHLCASDSLNAEDIDFTDIQIQRFFELLDSLKKLRIARPKTHILSSYGVLNRYNAKCDYARIGLALYGAQGKARQELGLKPVLSLKARVTHMSRIAAGESIGYGREFVAKRDTFVAVIAIGYADGIPRNLNDKGEVLIHGCRAPIAGRICMDQLMADVTDIPGVQKGDAATLIGRDGEEVILAEEISAKAGTIPNELLSRFSGRLERIVVY